MNSETPGSSDSIALLFYGGKMRARIKTLIFCLTLCQFILGCTSTDWNPSDFWGRSWSSPDLRANENWQVTSSAPRIVYRGFPVLLKFFLENVSKEPLSTAVYDLLEPEGMAGISALFYRGEDYFIWGCGISNYKSQDCITTRKVARITLEPRQTAPMWIDLAALSSHQTLGKSLRKTDNPTLGTWKLVVRDWNNNAMCGPFTVSIVEPSDRESTLLSLFPGGGGDHWMNVNPEMTFDEEFAFSILPQVIRDPLEKIRLLQLARRSPEKAIAKLGRGRSDTIPSNRKAFEHRVLYECLIAVDEQAEASRLLDRYRNESSWLAVPPERRWIVKP